jgi:hypothetical protein
VSADKAVNSRFGCPKGGDAPAAAEFYGGTKELQELPLHGTTASIQGCKPRAPSDWGLPEAAAESKRRRRRGRCQDGAGRTGGESHGIGERVGRAKSVFDFSKFKRSGKGQGNSSSIARP